MEELVDRSPASSGLGRLLLKATAHRTRPDTHSGRRIASVPHGWRASGAISTYSMRGMDADLIVRQSDAFCVAGCVPMA